MRIAATPRDRRAVQFGVSVVVILLILGRGLPALRALEQETAFRAAAADQRADAVQRERDALSRALTASRHRGAPESRAILDLAFVGANATETGARASQYAVGLARGTGGVVHSVSPGTADAVTGPVSPLEIRLAFSTDGRGLFAFMDEVVRGPRLLVVRRLSVSHNDPSGAPTEPERLSVDVTLTAVSQTVRGERTR